MDIDTARELLQTGPEAGPEERRQAFDRQRRLLEGLLGTAATPALAEQYRAAVSALTTAFEHLELHHAAAASPALRHVTTSSLLPPQPPAVLTPSRPAAIAALAPAPAPIPPSDVAAPSPAASPGPLSAPASAPAPTPSAAPLAPSPAAVAIAPAPAPAPAHAHAHAHAAAAAAAAAEAAPAARSPAPRRGRWVLGAAALLAIAGGTALWLAHARQLRHDALLARVQAVRDQLQACASGLPAALIPDSHADAVRRQYLAARATQRSSLEQACQQWLAQHPAEHTADEAEQDLAGGRLNEAELALARAQRAVADPHGAAELAALIRDGFAQPWWAWVWGHAASDARQTQWFVQEDGALAAQCADLVHAQLEVLDLAQPIDAKDDDLIGQLCALRPADAQLPHWRAKLAEVARLRALLELQATGFERADPLRRDVVAACVDRLAALVGPADAQVAAWRKQLPQDAGALERLGAHFQRLSAKDALPEAGDIELLRLIAQGLGASGSEIARIAAEAPDRLLAAAEAAQDDDSSADQLVRAAGLCSWTALARLVELRSWGSFARIDPGLFDAAHAPPLALGITARQLQGELLANWACRQHDGKSHAADMVRARELMCADAITHPVVMHEAAWLWDEYAPTDPAQVKDLRTRSAALVEQLLARTPSPPLARWANLLALRVDEEAVELADRAHTLAFLDGLAKTLADQPAYAALAQVAQGGLLGSDPADLAAADQALRRACEQLRALPSCRPCDLVLALSTRASLALGAKNPQRDLVRASVLEHEAAAVAAQAHMDVLAGRALNAAARAENQGQDKPEAAQDYGLAATAFAHAGRANDQAAALVAQAETLTALPTPQWDAAAASLARAAEVAEDLSWRGKAAYNLGELEGDSRNPARRLGAAIASLAAAADWYAKDGNGESQVFCLIEEAGFEKPSGNPSGSWERVRATAQQALSLAGAAKNHGQVCSCDLLLARSYLPSDNPAGDYATAGTWYSQAAAAAEQDNDAATEAHALHQQALCTQPDNNKAGSWSQAIALYRRSADMSKPLAGAHGVEITLANEASCFQPDTNPDGSWSSALALYRESIGCAETAGSLLNQGIGWSGVGLCLEPGNDASASWQASFEACAKAVGFLRQAVASDDERHANPGTAALDRKRLAAALFELALASMPANNPQGDWAKAGAEAEEAAGIYGNMGDAINTAHCLGVRARTLRPDEGNLGSWAQAADLFDKAQALSAQAKDQKQQAIYLQNQGVCLYKGNGESLNDAARQALQQSADIAHTVGDAQTEANARSWLK